MMNRREEGVCGGKVRWELTDVLVDPRCFVALICVLSAMVVRLASDGFCVWCILQALEFGAKGVLAGIGDVEKSILVCVVH